MPGPHTLRLQVALTDVETSSAGLDAVTTVLPVGIAISMVKDFATGKPTFVGEASIEFRVVDSCSRVLLTAGVDRKVGGKTLKEIDSWTDADNAMEDWAKTIRSRLCFLRGESICK